MDPTVALVPLRAPGRGKSRLADVLDPQQRAALSVAMLGDVTAALAAAGLTEVVVLAGGRAAAAAAGDLGLGVLLDPVGSGGLNDALSAASGRLGTRRNTLVVAADLPRLGPDDVGAVLAADAEVVIAPTAAGGTGVLLRRPATVIDTAYGPGSAIAHRALAIAARARTICVDRDGIHHDVDTFTDLVALTEVEIGPATAAILPQLLGPRPLQRQPVG